MALNHKSRKTAAAGGLFFVAVVLAILLAVFFARMSNRAPGWGIDSGITTFASDHEFPGYVRLLQTSGIRVLRERNVGDRLADGSYAPDVRAKFRALKKAGFTVLAFASTPEKIAVKQEGDALPEDLNTVFAQGRILGRDFAGLVDAWEMIGEPDVGYCTDLPDRVAAYQKALYLGIKSSLLDPTKRPPIVVMGALALPPGPWLDRAAQNGILDYTDAYNFHFYGHPEDLRGVIDAHQAFEERWDDGRRADLPLWLTECGMNAVTSDDFSDPARRQLQSQFTLSTAGQARRAGLALFMPFILAHPGDPHALTLSAEQPFPAWTAYAALTRGLPWPCHPWARPAPHPNPVVMQWMPDNATTIPHKVSGTYRFREGVSLRGEVRIYNFGDKAVRGRFEADTPSEVASTFPNSCEIALEPGQTVVLSGEFIPVTLGYFQAWWRAKFTAADGSRSPLYFGLERRPQEKDFSGTPLRLEPLPAGRVHHPVYDEYLVTSSAGPWLGLNGVQVSETSGDGTRFRVIRLVGHSEGDPLFPPMAAARIAGLPADGFLHVIPDSPLTIGDFALRVDLVDDIGQRFTIWENLGQSYDQPVTDLWLNVHDFHPYFWGHCSVMPRLRPEKIREIQLRFYCAQAGGERTVELSWGKPLANTRP